jgi:LAO/AO transport system kinase
LTDVERLCQGVLRGDRRSTARLITIIEDGLPEARKAISLLYPHTGGAHVIGVTGPPGVGKSSLIEKLIQLIRVGGETVGVVAVDPTSPYSGGAFLGDRVRMQGLGTDDGVFIRSMATRGGHGGVARATRDAVKVLDASGKDYVIVETVGAGQSEVEVIRVAETVVVVLSPVMGDEIQALKAGMMEIGDVFVVNKSDLPGSDLVIADIRSMLSMKKAGAGWEPPILRTVATTGEGVETLLDSVISHREHRRSPANEGIRRQSVEEMLSLTLRDRAAERLIARMRTRGDLDRAVERVLNREIDHYTAAEELLEAFMTPSAAKTEEDAQGLERGLVQVYTGEGKGKTSAAFGLALRAIGRGLDVYVIQFIKGGFDYGELHIAEDLPHFRLEAFGRGRFIDVGSPAEEDINQARLALERASRILEEGRHDILILDEVNVAIMYGLISVGDVLELIARKPERVELVLTGRGAPEEIIEAADLVTEMGEVKHPFSKGMRARRGIEY